MVYPVSNAASEPSTKLLSNSANGSGSDFDTFLKMLTTQLTNQDPLNPMEGTDFAVQLATFSSVEQQTQTNQLLNQMIAQMGGSGLGQAVDWIGKEARTTQPVWFGDTALTLDIQPDTRADDVILATFDAAGNEVNRELIGLGAGQIDWFGRRETGEKLPDGLYSFQIESTKSGEVIAQQDVAAYVRVIEVERDGDSLRLIFEGGSSALAQEVSALRIDN